VLKWNNDFHTAQSLKFGKAEFNSYLGSLIKRMNEVFCFINYNPLVFAGQRKAKV
jgi:hypothetical protein